MSQRGGEKGRERGRTGRRPDRKAMNERLAEWANHLSPVEGLKSEHFQSLCRTPEHAAVWEFLMGRVHRAETAQLIKDNLRVLAAAPNTGM